MQLGYSFSFILTAFILALAEVEAAPGKRPPRMVTLPLKRLPQPSDVPPSILLQQHINRSHRRHARMIGLDGPTDDELMKRMEKRLYRATVPKHDKRFYRDGVNVPTSNDVDVSIKGWDGLDPHVENLRKSCTPANNTGNSTNSEGFPQAALNALNAGNLTKAHPPTTPNSIGLDIEGNDVSYISEPKMHFSDLYRSVK